MARSSSSSSKATGRGSPEAVAKRRAARALNTIFAKEHGAAGGGLDGRTEKRRKRLIKELVEGRRGRPLKPIDVLTHASELLELGETLASLKKQGVKPIAAPRTPEMIEAAARVREAYSMSPEVFELIGLDIRSAGGRGKGT
jgi:hypothetical protein